MGPAFVASVGYHIVMVLAVQADGLILLGGSFSVPSDTEGVRSQTLIRLFADGTRDTSFDARDALLPYAGWHRAIASLLPQDVFG